MKTLAITGFAAIVAAVLQAAVLQAQEPPKPAAPEKEHEWLAQLAGQWVTEGEANLGPGLPPMKCTGTASDRMVGGLWLVTEQKMDGIEPPMTGIMTVGYDPAKKKFVGTWIDSMTAHLWKYEGTLDAGGKVLTLEAEGPNPMAPGKMGKFRDAIEVKSKDHKVLTSSLLGDDGKWVTFMTMSFRRKK